MVSWGLFIFSREEEVFSEFRSGFSVSERFYFPYCILEKPIDKEMPRLVWEEAAGVGEEELFGIKGGGGSGVAAAYVVLEDLESGFGKGSGVWREEEGMAFLGGV